MSVVGGINGVIMNTQQSEGRFLLSRREPNYCVRSHVMSRMQGYAKIPRRVPAHQMSRFWRMQVHVYASLFRPDN